MDLSRTLRRILPIALLLPATLSLASEPEGLGRRLLDLSPERMAAFQKALREFTGAGQAATADFYFQARYEPTLSEERPRQPSMLRGAAAEAEDIRVPYGRDLSFEQEFLVAGREDDYIDAAKNWASRTIKGSDAAARAPGRRNPGLHAAWVDGPVVGVRTGPFLARVGSNGDWRVRYSRRLASHPGWVMRAWVGSDDGDEVAAFTIGRSLVASTRRE